MSRESSDMTDERVGERASERGGERERERLQAGRQAGQRRAGRGRGDRVQGGREGRGWIKRGKTGGGNIPLSFSPTRIQCSRL
ncbi:hypothetical protein MPTK1_1g23980 [Marchantia polymorpha subsp. ruderalis]|uniref:Uncharacterized protein n=2 Tax=Marchantia polymorpha TaxID=3197 RepID=A0AAF6ATN7_MARPO|nr:hypothetical protein MARPO_0061s0122 [Marchantia polymorpha]BBM99807.1 hypothetical protein Mp_1g23980 [Marchantia polymorpha subsp. ruderalis]|eukprot:PTQ36877.1 hypothetical protein MARPO_0061s0122 [Marchantia polymorpha]